LPSKRGKSFFVEVLARIHYLSTTQIHRAWILFQQRAAAGWSFTDCTSKVVIGDLGIGAVASLDHHFEQFGIQVLPLP
jgi:predicted nucleic acid-binding protein